MLVNFDTQIVYAPRDRRGMVLGLAYFVENKIIKSVEVDYRRLKSLEDPETSERAIKSISRRLDEALDEKRKNDKKIIEIEESLKFLKKEYDEKGPVLTVPLHFQGFFVGYLSGTILTRTRKLDRYIIARNVPMLHPVFQPYDPNADDVIFFRSGKKMREVKKLLEEKINSFKHINESLFNNICSWENVLQTIKKGVYNSGFNGWGF